MRVAAVTMSYNAPDWAPVWARHYAAELGAANCFIIDHGSDDRSLDGLAGVNVIRIPRSPQDDDRRARALSLFCASLLQWYDAVIHPDPLARRVGRPRRSVRFASAMCKPVLIRTPVDWAPGFHSVPAAPAFGDLFLIHLRYADLGRGLMRLARTRSQPWQEEAAGRHQRMGDAEWEAMLRAMAGLPRTIPRLFSGDADPLASWLDRVCASAHGRERDRYRLDLHIFGDTWWRRPAAFVDRF